MGKFKKGAAEKRGVKTSGSAAKGGFALERNSEITITIDGLTSEGQGVGRYEGLAVFVPFTLPGETVRASVIKPTSSYAVAKLIEVVAPSPDRVEPRCDVFMKCGGCQLQHMRYDAQLVAKRRIVVDALTRIGGFVDADELTEPTVASNEYGYRSKGSFPVRSVDGIARAGMFAPRSHRLVPVDSCPIACGEVNAALASVSAWLEAERISGYDEEKHRGAIRHAAFRRASSGLMAVVVTNGDDLPKRRALLEELGECATSIVHNVNSERTNAVLGAKSKLIWGEPLTEELSGLDFYVSDHSFLQVNKDAAQRLYALVAESLDLTGSETVVDAYSGVGTIALTLAKLCGRVVGIECVTEAVSDAKANAERNDIKNAEFFEGVVEDVLPRLVQSERFDAVVLDPPRKGADRAAIDAVLASRAKTCVYVSCDPATLARDAKILCEGGYRLVRAVPVDMFAQTAHVETLAVFRR